jgi:hypothetical protein
MLTFVVPSFVIYLHAHTLPDPQSSKVGKTEKSELAVSRGKSPNQRGYEDVRSRGAQKGGDRLQRRREAIAGISLPLFGETEK